MLPQVLGVSAELHRGEPRWLGGLVYLRVRVRWLVKRTRPRLRRRGPNSLYASTRDPRGYCQDIRLGRDSLAYMGVIISRERQKDQTSAWGRVAGCKWRDGHLHVKRQQTTFIEFVHSTYAFQCKYNTSDSLLETQLKSMALFTLHTYIHRA